MFVECDIRPPQTAVPTDEGPAVEREGDREAYPQSVAAGDPTPEGVVLWTRVDPGACDEAADLFVEVTEADGRDRRSARFVDPAYRGRVEAGVDPDRDHTVRIDLDGRLQPGREYHYRFVHDGAASPVGRCRTLPTPDGSPTSVSFVLLACQDYQNGYYGALAHAAREDADFAVHLGDFIYDSAERQYTGLGSDPYPDREVTLPSREAVAHSLEDFRELYRIYHGDRHLQSFTESHTLIRTWDDHAVADNRFWDYEVDAPVLPSHPRGDDPRFAERLTAAGIQAWNEYTPARVEYDPDAAHLHDAFSLHREFRFGDLLTLLVTDERLFRSPPPCHDRPFPEWLPGPVCPGRRDPERTMLGYRQRRWLIDRLGWAPTHWTAWANEVLSLPFDVGLGPASFTPLVDSWDGYAAERARLFDAMAGNDRSANVTLTGDLHSYIVGEQRRRPASVPRTPPEPRATSGPRALTQGAAGDGTEGEVVGVEFMTPAVTSVNLAEAIGVEEGVLGRVSRPLFRRAVLGANPHFDLFDSHHWGYATVTFGREDCRYVAYAVDKSVDDAHAPKRRLADVRVPRDRLL
jgi:alkaline phosphatase D